MLGFVGYAYAHTVDSVEDYRLEIGWMNEPVVSGETNGIELFASPLEPNLPLEEQQFRNGVTGLEKTMKVQLVFKGKKITLPLSADHNIPGKYYAFVDPTIPGFYQANILGNIGETKVSLSMHPPEVKNRSYIEFPIPSDEKQEQILDEHITIQKEMDEIRETLKRIESSNQTVYVGYTGMGFGIIGIVIALIAISRKR